MAKLTAIISEKADKIGSYIRENLLPNQSDNIGKGFHNWGKGFLYGLGAAGLGIAGAGVTALGGVAALGGALIGAIATGVNVVGSVHGLAGTVQIGTGVVQKIAGNAPSME